MHEDTRLDYKPIFFFFFLFYCRNAQQPKINVNVFKFQRICLTFTLTSCPLSSSSKKNKQNHRKNNPVVFTQISEKLIQEQYDGFNSKLLKSRSRTENLDESLNFYFYPSKTHHLVIPFSDGPARVNFPSLLETMVRLLAKPRAISD